MNVTELGIMGGGVFSIMFLGAVSGGVGPLKRAILVFFGIPPDIAVGTLSIADFFSQGVSVRRFQKHKAVDWKLVAILSLPSVIGSVVGAKLMLILNPALLQKMIGIMTLVVGVFMIMHKENTTQGISPRATSVVRLVTGIIVLLIARALSVVTSGAGQLLSYALILIYKKSWFDASGTKRVVEFIGGGFAALVFFRAGLFTTDILLVALVASVLGTVLGIEHAAKKGERRMKRVSLFIYLLTGIGMLIW